MNFRSPLIYKAFTLIELLIVIVIIGILATAFIPKITGMQNRARYARVEKDFRDFRAAVFLAQSNTNKTLDKITMKHSTYASCAVNGYFVGVNFYDFSANHPCRTDWIDSLRKIEQAAGMDSGSLVGLETDPWGKPYMFDENEGQHGTGGCNTQDLLYMTGPDGYYFGHNAGLIDDDRILKIPPMGCPGAY